MCYLPSTSATPERSFRNPTVDKKAGLLARPSLFGAPSLRWDRLHSCDLANAHLNRDQKFPLIIGREEFAAFDVLADISKYGNDAAGSRSSAHFRARAALYCAAQHLTDELEAGMDCHDKVSISTRCR